jgi:hypothetical protein
VGYDGYTPKPGAMMNYAGILWEIDGSAKRLSSLVSGWKQISFANGINNDGVIAADGQLVANGKPHALIMIPPQ